MAAYATSILQTKMDTLLSERQQSEKRITDAQAVINRETEVLAAVNHKIKELEKAVKALTSKKEAKSDKAE